MNSGPQTAPFPACTAYNGLLFTSGQIALDPLAALTPEGLRPVCAEFEAQARACLDNLESVLRAAGSGLEHVLRLECFLTDDANLRIWHAVFLERFHAPRPARTTLIARPPAAGFLIEVQAIAVARPTGANT